MDREPENPPWGRVEPNRQLDEHRNGQTRRFGGDERRIKGRCGCGYRILGSGHRVQGEGPSTPGSLFALVHADAQLKVTRESLQFKHKLSPYQGFTLKGKVRQVYLRGKLAHDKDTGFDEFSPSGKLL